MIFWSFLAGVVTFYCSLGPASLLPNFLFTVERKPKVNTIFNIFIFWHVPWFELCWQGQPSYWKAHVLVSHSEDLPQIPRPRNHRTCLCKYTKRISLQLHMGQIKRLPQFKDLARDSEELVMDSAWCGLIRRCLSKLGVYAGRHYPEELLQWCSGTGTCTTWLLWTSLTLCAIDPSSYL